MAERAPAPITLVLLLGALVAAAFAPLLAGMNFIPFTRTPDFSLSMALASGQEYAEDRNYLDRNRNYFWFQEMEASSVNLLYPQERFTAAQLHRGIFPLWDPFTGCGTPTLDNGFFRPFNPLRLAFYAVPSSWTYCFSLLLGLVLGAWGAFLWLREEVGNTSAAALGSGLFVFNPWALEHLVLPDAPSYFLLPWCLLSLTRARWSDWASMARAAFLFAIAWPLSLDQLAWNRLDIRSNPMVEWVRSTRPHDRCVSPSGRPVFALPPNLGQVFSVRCGEQFAVLFPNYYSQLYRRAGIPFTYVAFDRIEPFAFRQLGASLALLPSEADPGGLPRLYRDPWLSAYDIPGASGRLFFASKVAPRDPALRIDRQIVSLGTAEDTAAVVEAMGQGAMGPLPGVPKGLGSASFLSDGIHRVRVRANSPSGGLLVLRDTWYPGWRATVDGAPAPIYRVNGCFRGVPVPAGTHEVEFNYSPHSLYAAGAVSTAALLLLVWGCLSGFRRRGEGGAAQA